MGKDIKKRTKRPSIRLKRSCIDFIEIFSELIETVLDYGITMVLRVPECDGTSTIHIMFNRKEDGSRLLDYWPGNGSYRTYDGERGSFEQHTDSLKKAIEISISDGTDIAADKLSEMDQDNINHLRSINGMPALG